MQLATRLTMTTTRSLGPTTTWLQDAIEYEHRFDESPFSVFAAISLTSSRRLSRRGACCDEDVIVSTFRVGRMNLHEGTLQSEDVTGARTFGFPNLRAPVSYAGELN